MKPSRPALSKLRHVVNPKAGIFNCTSGRETSNPSPQTGHGGKPGLGGTGGPASDGDAEVEGEADGLADGDGETDGSSCVVGKLFW